MFKYALVFTSAWLCSACWASDPQALDPAQSDRCGDGSVTGDETCDTAIRRGRPGACPTECVSADACTESVLEGKRCKVGCVRKPITAIGLRDGCCPSGANAQSDADCVPRCGNGVVEADETCDPPQSCRACAADDPCVKSVSTGSADSCDLRCHYQAIAECGRDPVVDSGQTEDAGVVGDASANSDPAYEQCVAQLGVDSCARCQCARCGVEVAHCQGNSNREERAACANLVDCKAASECTNPDCYCGTSSLFTCLTGMADGPCKNEIATAAKSSQLLDIDARTSDLNYALGRANALASCVASACSAECSR